MQSQCWNHRRCGRTVPWSWTSGTRPGPRIFCDHACFVDKYLHSATFRGDMQIDKHRCTIYVHRPAGWSGNGITMATAHEINWFMQSHSFRVLKWDLWNPGTASAAGVTLTLNDSTLVREEAPPANDKDTCLCIAGIALTCKVPDGCHWGQPGYKGGTGG